MFSIKTGLRDCLASPGNEWNERVLRQIVAPCAVKLIQSEIGKVETKAKECDADRVIKRILELLPGKSPQLDDLQKGVFEILGKKAVKVFPVVQITGKVSVKHV